MVNSCLYGCGAVLKVPSMVSHRLRMQALPSVLTGCPGWTNADGLDVSAHSPWMSVSARDLWTGLKHSP